MKRLMTKLLKFIKILLIVAAFILFAAIIFVGVDNGLKDTLAYVPRFALANFIIFASIIILVCVKLNVNEKLELAKQGVVNDIEKSKETKLESELELQKIEESVAKIQNEIDEILLKADNNAVMVGDKIIDDANNTVNNIQKSTDRAIDSKTGLIRNDILKRVSKASIEVAKNQIKQELNNNPDLHNKLIDESIDAIGVI